MSKLLTAIGASGADCCERPANGTGNRVCVITLGVVRVANRRIRSGACSVRQSSQKRARIRGNATHLPGCRRRKAARVMHCYMHKLLAPRSSTSRRQRLFFPRAAIAAKYGNTEDSDEGGVRPSIFADATASCNDELGNG